MFSDDEDELELLRQYGDRDLHAEDEEGHSSDEMDSDLEDKIMSMVQYGSGLKKKTPLPETKEPEVVHAPEIEANKKHTTFSTANELQISNDNDESSNDEYESAEEDVGVPETPATLQESKPQITRYINLDDKHYMDDEETSEEEAELNSKLQDLIDEQISKRQTRSRYISKPIRVCFGCHQPGHERKDCNLCPDCGGKRHPDARCVGVRYCSKCKLRGHSIADCDNEREHSSCALCHLSYHNKLNCPSLLHVYENEKPSKKKPVPYCYNCTDKGHYGDECPDLPKYLSTVPSVFSQLSLSVGSRFDPKKTLKSSAASFSKSSSHQRWSDSSRDSSPRYNGDRNNYANNNNSNSYNNNNSYKKRRFNDSDNEINNRNNNGSSSNNNRNRSDDRDYKNKGNANSYKDNNAGGKRRRTDLEDSRSNLNNFFTPAKNNNKKKGKESQQSNTYNGKSGNSNWKAMNNSTLPQPTRSGTVNINKGKGVDRGNQQDYSGDFPRGNGSSLPRPSSSGVIDLTKDDDGYSKRGPKYHGGYNRR